MYLYCESRACFTGRNYLTNWVTERQKLEEDSTAVKLVRLRMRLYVHAEAGETGPRSNIECGVSFPLRMQRTTASYLSMLTLITNIPSVGKF